MLNKHTIESAILEISQLLGVAVNEPELKLKVSRITETSKSFSDFIQYLNQTAATVNLAFVSQEFSKAELKDILQRLSFPLIVFRKSASGESIETLILGEKQQKLYGICADTRQPLTDAELSALPDQILSYKTLLDNSVNEEKYLFTLGPVEITSQFSADVSDNLSNQIEVFSPLKRFFKFIASEKRNITYIYIYSIVIGLISLTLPLGIQAIIGLISGGMLFDSVVVLITFVILAVAIGGGLQIIQIYLVEILERRIFAKAAFEFAFRIPRIKSETLLNKFVPELMNRFFDVLTLQKNFSKILLDITAAALQIIFGMILLSFYHYAFIFFGLITLLVLFLMFRYTAPKGLKTNIKESTYKYKVVSWFEEVARNLYSFKMAGFSNISIDRTDYELNNYLGARKKHFNVLLSHFISITIFKLVITAGTLIIGTLLVVNKEITLGQFVASEIVIILIINATEKIVLNMNVVYDVLTALEKIAQVTDLPLEPSLGIPMKADNESRGLRVELRNVSYQFSNKPNAALKNINLIIEPGERVVLTGTNGSGKHTLTKILTGLHMDFNGLVLVNQISIKSLNRDSLHNLIASNISGEGIFEGTLEENIRMGKPELSQADVVDVVDQVGLTPFVNQLNDGIYTQLLPTGKGLPTSVHKKIILARNVIKKPKMLIFDDLFVNIERQERQQLLEYLLDRSIPQTIVAVSVDPILMRNFDRVIVLNEGEVVADGPYNDIIKQPEIETLLKR